LESRALRSRTSRDSGVANREVAVLTYAMH
jgi:hypothetical protein